MKNAKAAGTRRELQVVAAYRDAGWVAFRTPASLGVCDVVAMRQVPDEDFASSLPREWAEVHMVEVKATGGGPYERFQPRERDALREAAARAGATALLCWWPPGGVRVDIEACDWPERRSQRAAA